MAAYSRTASQFLANTFAPFGVGGVGGNHHEDDAPLFFSSVDGESHDGGATEDGLYSRYYDDGGVEDTSTSQSYTESRGRSNARSMNRSRHDQQLPYQARRTNDDDRIAEEEGEQLDHHVSSTGSSPRRISSANSATYYEHDGLGAIPSAAASDTSDDPFRSNGASSRQSGRRTPATTDTGNGVISAAAAAATTRPGWCASTNATRTPAVKQSLLHNLYEQSESVYTSVFIGGNNPTKHIDKGKQRERDNVIEQRNAIGLHQSLGTSQISPQLPAHVLAIHHEHARRGDSPYLGQSQLQQTTPLPPRIHRYPMPTSKYRRTATIGKNTGPAEDLEWQDQSYRDPLWLGLYLFNVLLTTCLGLYLFLFDHVADNVKTPSTSHLIAPSLAVLRSIPLLSLLILLSLILSGTTMAYVLLVKNGARQIAFAMLLLPPIVFLIGAGWAFEASYAILYDQDGQSAPSSTSWASRTLQLFSLFLLGCAALSFRRTWKNIFSSDSASHRAKLERTIRVLEVSSTVLVQHPQLIVLAIVLVATYIVSSVPVILMIAKLLYHGILVNATDGLPTSQYSFLIPSAGSIILSLHTVFVYFWSLGLLRAVYQHTIAGTVAAWWYGQSDKQLPADKPDSAGRAADKNPFDSEANREAPKRLSLREARMNVSDAVHRATGPSLGTLCASSLILAILAMVNLLIGICYTLINRSRRWTSTSLFTTILRTIISFVVMPLVAILGGMIRNLNSFTLVYSAVTGDRFWESSAQASDLIMGRNGTDMVANRE